MFVLPTLALLLLAPSELKCSKSSMTRMPGYAMREPVVLVDAAVTSQSGMDALAPEEVGYVGIMCWNPLTNSFEHLGEGIPVIWIITETTIERARAPLRQVIDAQENFRARHARYAADAESLEAFGLSTDVKLVIEGSESGWRASTPADHAVYQCSARRSSPSAEDEQAKLDCAPVAAIALRALRARYDAGR
jgi:hypothetical protein